MFLKCLSKLFEKTIFSNISILWFIDFLPPGFQGPSGFTHPLQNQTNSPFFPKCVLCSYKPATLEWWYPTKTSVYQIFIEYLWYAGSKLGGAGQLWMTWTGSLPSQCTPGLGLLLISLILLSDEMPIFPTLCMQIFFIPPLLVNLPCILQIVHQPLLWTSSILMSLQKYQALMIRCPVPWGLVSWMPSCLPAKPWSSWGEELCPLVLCLPCGLSQCSVLFKNLLQVTDYFPNWI